MDKRTATAESRSLRGIVTRLNNSNPALPSQLILTAQRSVSDLAFCSTIISASDEQLKGLQGDVAVAVHSFRTKISSLLQDTHASARLAAILLVKAAIHFGGYEVLSKSGATWTRALLNIFSRPCATSTRRLIIIVLLQIYRATQNLPNLTREVTTPTLKDFIPACIKLVTVKNSDTNQRVLSTDAPILPDVLQAFAQLLPHHPNVFRSFTNNLSEFCGTIIASGSSNDQDLSIVLPSTRALAQRLFALIPTTAARNASAEQWTKNIRLINDHITQTADEIYRSVVEATTSGLNRMSKVAPNSSGQPGGQLVDGLRLDRWAGLEAGVERLCGLLQTLQAHLVARGTPSAPYSIPLDMILGIVERVMNVFPGQKLDAVGNVSHNVEISREERDLLFLRAGRLQIEALSVLRVLFHRIGGHSAAIASGALEYLSWCFGSGVSHHQLRASFFDTVTVVLEVSGQGLNTKVVQALGFIIEAACHEMYPDEDKKAGGGTRAGKNSADAYLTTTKATESSFIRSPSHSSATRLVETILSDVSAAAIPNNLRNIIDRAVVLAREEPAMLNSVLNISVQQPFTAAQCSIIPFLAREHAKSTRTEALLRPRLSGISRSQLSSQEQDTVETTGNTIHQFAGSFGQEEGLDDDELPDAEAEQPSSGANIIPTMTVLPPSISTTTQPASYPTLDSAMSPGKRNFEDAKILPPSQPQDPKRARIADSHALESDAEARHVKLATFEPAAGPNSVSVIEEPVSGHVETSTLRQPEQGTATAEDSDSDGSSLPSIHMGDDFDDSDEDENEDK